MAISSQSKVSKEEFIWYSVSDVRRTVEHVRISYMCGFITVALFYYADV